jgi:hypothetical protein
MTLDPYCSRPWVAIALTLANAYLLCFITLGKDPRPQPRATASASLLEDVPPQAPDPAWLPTALNATVAQPAPAHEAAIGPAATKRWLLESRR